MWSVVRVSVAVVGVLLLVASGTALAEVPDHVHPDEVDESGDRSALERWLGDRIGELHADCSEGLSIGDFDACEDLNDEYESLLERYVTIERETTDDEDERDGETFEKARDEQVELAELLERFEATHEEYESARAAGDEERARELVRELRRLADRIDELGGDLEVRFRALDDATAADFEAAANQTQMVADETLTVTVTAEQDTFEAANLTVDVDPEATFSSPAAIAGRLTTDDGTAISGVEVVVTDDADFREAVTTDDEGRFESTYRPTTAEIGETPLEVEYVPEVHAPYLGTTGTATTDVSPTQSTVVLETVSEDAAFGEDVVAAGYVTADGDRPTGIPVRLSVGGETLERGSTDADGRFAVSGSLPAAVETGEATLEVRTSRPETAVSVADASRQIWIEPTATDLSATTAEYDSDSVAIEGELATVDGLAVAGRPVTVAVDGETQTVTTDDDGRYRAVVTRPETDREATINYSEPATNLERSQTRVSLRSVPDDDGGVSATVSQTGEAGIVETLRSFVADRPVLTVGLAVGFLANLLVWLVVAWRRLDSVRDDSSSSPVEESSLESATRAVDEGERRDGADRGETGTTDPLAPARAALPGDPSTAVQLAYATVRSTLESGDEAAETRTHWEVYREAIADLDDERRSALRSVIEAFETATFAPGPLDEATAEAAVDDAERYVTATDGGESR